MNAKQYLKQSYRLNELIKSEMEELNQLRNVSICLDYSKDKIQTSQIADDKMVNTVDKIIELENLIRSHIDKMIDLKTEIRNVIDAVDNVDEKLLLKLKYLNFHTFDEIVDDMHISISTVHRIHGNALRNVNLIVNESK